MTGQAVPNDQQLIRQMTHQMFEELDYLRTLDGAGKEPKVKVPPRHPCHCRQSLPVEGVLQHRVVSPRRPGAAAGFAQSQAFSCRSPSPAEYVERTKAVDVQMITKT